MRQMAQTTTGKAASAAVLVVSVCLLVMGSRQKIKAYETNTDEFGLQTWTPVTGRQLVEDATFGGVVRKDNRLFSTYDRLKPRGKVACPT